MKRRVARHHGLDAIDVVGVDSLLELPDLLEGIDVSLELRPTRKPVETRDLELRIGERCRRASLEQVLGLVLQMAKIGAIGKWAWCLGCGSVDIATSFHRSARCPHIGLKEGRGD